MNYGWPGNVRELENAVERSVIIASGRQIELDDLPEAVTRHAIDERVHLLQERIEAASQGRAITLKIDVPSSIDEIERRAIEATLDYTAGDKTRAARALGIGRKTLYRKLQQYDGARDQQ
jgi:two-component system response regulator HydG